MADVTTAAALPQRADIDIKFTWNLGDLYKNDDAWEADYARAENLIEKAAGYAGKLGEAADLLYECLDGRTQLFLICGDLYQYAKLSQDLDNRVSKYQAMTDRAAMLTSRANAAFAFMEPELLTIDDTTLMNLAGQFPKTDEYDFYLKDLIRSREHVRSGEVEELLAESAMIARGPGNIYTMLDDADMTYPTIKDEQGREVRLTKQRFARFMESSDQRVRLDAHEGFIQPYRDHINTIGASLSTSVSKDIFLARARKYESCLHHALDAGNIPVAVYHQLLDTTEANLEPLHKWMALRRKILGLDKMYTCDIYNPLFPEQNFEVAYNDAVREVLEAVEPLGEKYRETLSQAFANRWVDVYETEGKGSGAYSWGNYSTHPFILMNYNNTINNMFTLAHEMGHAMHSYFSNRAQPFIKSQYSIFVAEVASTLNEGLLLQYLLKKMTDVKQKLFLLNRHIDNTLGTFFHQVLYARFELQIHQMVEDGKALSPDTMNELWEGLTRKYYGPAVTIDDYIKYKWSRIPHFYRAYYVYQYATSYTASQAVLDKFLAGKPGIVDNYLKLLSMGGSDYPIDELKVCDVDMTTPDPVLATLKLFSEQVDEVARLTGN